MKDVPRIIMVKNKFCIFSEFLPFDVYEIIVTLHAYCWCLFWLIYIEENKQYT